MTTPTLVDPRPPRCPDHRARKRGIAGFQAGCAVCRTYAAWYGRYTRRLRAAGAWEPNVPVEQISPHLLMLREQGMSDEQVAAISGCPEITVRAVRCHYWTVVRPDIAAALLGVALLPPEQRLGYIDSTGALRRLAAFSRAAWDQKTVAVHLGCVPSTVRSWTTKRRKTMRACEVHAIRALYDTHVRTTGPSPMAAARARTVGWLPWYAWRDDIDDPKAQPDDKVPARGTIMRMRALATMGRSPYDIAAEYPDLDGAALDALMRSLGKGSRTRTVARWVRNAVAHAYDAHEHDIDGPTPALAVEARELGWWSPLAWAGQDIDDMHSFGHRGLDYTEPVPVVSAASVALALSGHTGRTDLTSIEAVIVVGMLREQGLSDEQIALRLSWPGVNPVEAVKRLMAPSRRPIVPAGLLAEYGLPPDERSEEYLRERGLLSTPSGQAKAGRPDQSTRARLRAA